MNNFWWNKYIGIPYKMMGCSMEGCDCWGLVRLVYKNEFGIDIPSVTIDMTDHANMELIPMGLDAMWDKTDNPQPGDVINFHVLGHDQHVGIVTAPGQMLHVFDNGHTSCIETYTSRKWKNRIAGIYTYAHAETLVPENEDGVSVIGKPHPLKPRITTVMPAGRSLEEIITTMCDEMGIPERLREYGAACVNLTYIPRDRWATTFPKNGDTVIFRLRGVAGGGGGGFRSILGIVAIVAAAALTWWAGGSGAGVVAGILGVTEGVAAGLMAVTALGLTIAGMALLNNSIAAKPSMGSIDSGNFVDAKFLSGGNNSTRPYETIPQVLGIGRMTFDFLCKPYTEQADNYTNYLRVAYTAGYGPVEITNIRNGDTDIEKYNDFQCNVYTGYGDDQTPKIYTSDAEEMNVNVTLGKYDHNYRTTVDDVDQIQVVLYWPQGLWYRNNRGDKCNITSTGIIRYRAVNGEWEDLHVVVRPSSIAFSSCSPMVVKTTSTHSEYSEQWYNRYGNTKYTYSNTKTYTLYRWYTVTIQQGTCNIRNYGGGITDRMYDEPSDEYWDEYIKKTYSLKDIVFGRVPDKPARIVGVPTGELLLAYVCVCGDKIIEVEDKRESSGIEGCELTTSGLELNIAKGAIENAGITTWHITKSNEMRAFTQVYTFDVQRGQYEIDVQLTSADDEEKAGWDAQAALQVQWLVMRTFTFRPPFTPRKPLAWLEMRIRATDQISGSLDEINGMVASIVKDYDYETDTWVERISDNPASLFRHVLQGPAIPDDYRVDDAHIDLEKLKDWHNYCRIQGFTYFRVLGADSGMSVYEVLTEIAAAGYAKPVLKPEEGGIWSVWIDEPQTTVMQHFTEHNTWGVQWTKKTIDIPHAIRATFVNKDKGYEQDTVTVYIDGHDESNSTKFENWSVDYFKGITDIKQVQRVCRRAMAFAKLRPETLSFMCAMEYVTSQVGDLVRVTNSFVQWGLGSGWVVDTITNDEGGIIGLVLSESVTLTAGIEHSIRVRRADAKGTSFKADIPATTKSQQTNKIMFGTVIVDSLPSPGDLYQFGYKDRESHECIITAIEPESGDIARITVCDYAPELFDIDDGPIPDYDADISKPPFLPSAVVSKPVFVDAMSDEQVLLVSSNGSLTPRLAIVWARPDDCQDNVTHIQFRYRTSENGVPVGEPSDEGVTDGSTQEPGSWYILDPMTIENTTAFITPVTELYKYDVYARFLTRTGITGPWATMVRAHRIIGKYTAPPPPDMVYLDGYTVIIQQSNRPVDVVGHEIWMAFDPDDPFEYALKLSTPYVTDLRFDLSSYAGNARQVFVRTIDSVGLTSTPVRLAIDLGDVLPENILFTISERYDNKWGGALTGGYIFSDELFSESAVDLWGASDKPLWDIHTVWPSGTAERLTYIWRVYIAKSYKGAHVSVVPEYISGKLISIEMRTLQYPDMWPANGNKLWSNNSLLWPEPIPSDWRVFPSDYITNGGETIEFRLTMSPEVVAHILDIVTIIDVPDKEWTLSDVEIPVEGIYVDIPEKYFRAITNVTFGMQYREGLTATSVRRIFEQQAPIDEDGFLIRGPLVKGYDPENKPAIANVDIRMKGY